MKVSRYYIYLGCDVSILFSISVTVVSIDIIRPSHAIYRLKNNSTVIICYHISIPTNITK